MKVNIPTEHQIRKIVRSETKKTLSEIYGELHRLRKRVLELELKTRKSKTKFSWNNEK